MYIYEFLLLIKFLGRIAYSIPIYRLNRNVTEYLNVFILV